MTPATRRAFLSDVGRGMLAAGLGATSATDLGFSTAFAQEGSASIPLGDHARLVELMRNTPPEKLQPLLATRILKGETTLKQLVAAYHAGVQSAPFPTPAYPTDEHRALVKASDADALLAETEDAIRHNDQGRATAAIQIYGEREHAVEPVFQLMLKYAVSEDGRLHGEKYYQTVREEYRTTRPAFRWRQVVGLARVTASAFGYNREDQLGFRAAGYEDACRLLGVHA